MSDLAAVYREGATFCTYHRLRHAISEEPGRPRGRSICGIEGDLVRIWTERELNCGRCARLWARRRAAAPQAPRAAPPTPACDSCGAVAVGAFDCVDGEGATFRANYCAECRDNACGDGNGQGGFRSIKLAPQAPEAPQAPGDDEGRDT